MRGDDDTTEIRKFLLEQPSISILNNTSARDEDDGIVSNET